MSCWAPGRSLQPLPLVSSQSSLVPTLCLSLPVPPTMENPSLGLPMFHSPSTQPAGLPASPVSGKSGWDPGSLDPDLLLSPLLSIASLYRPNCCLVATNGRFVGNSLRTIHLSQAEVKLLYCKVSSVCLVWFGLVFLLVVWNPTGLRTLLFLSPDIQ